MPTLLDHRRCTREPGRLAVPRVTIDVRDVTPEQRAEVAHYVATGDYESTASAWPGNVIERETRHDDALRAGLVAEIKRRTRGRRLRSPKVDSAALTRERVEPMVRGLFPRSEHAIVLGLLERAVVFVIPETIELVLREACSWLSTTWNIANMYLSSIDAEPLGPDAPDIVGLSCDLRCYVTMQYIEHRRHVGLRFDDFVVHECAHVLHDAKPERIGLPEKRSRERLVDLEFRKRETFAYACEAYRMIVEYGPRLRDRGVIVDELARRGAPGDETVDAEEILDILREAASARNGWKRLLSRCAEGARTVPS